jgi:phenylalanyl-tRNA synthetase beta chain
VKVVLSWLRELCPTDLPVDELAHRLTAQGVKVESVARPWERLAGVVVARVLEVRDHPNSDKLCLARVSYGAGERELVVGVRNMKPGDLVPLAGPGASVPALDQPLGERTIRGVVSEGMLCSPRELAITTEHTGILVLPPDTPVGADFGREFGLLPEDAVLDIEVWSNRPDLLSILGVAREAAVATGAPLTLPDATIEEGPERAAEAATVEVLDLDRCPRYLARVIRGPTVGGSPILVQARLTASGMRPVSNVVDATNYVMLEMGQPMHPFDLSLLAGRGVVVRRAEPGEKIVTLDGVERRLTPEDLLIADREKGVGIAGVMGSASAEVSASTDEVLLESAHFERRGVLLSARRLGLQTEASIRFGRGTDPEAVDRAGARAAKLTAEWSGGTVLAGAIDVGRAPERRRVSLRPSRAAGLLGYDVTEADARSVFDRLGMAVTPAAGALEVETPSYRWDLEQEVDLIEEVARVQGYDRVGETLPAIRQPGGVPATWDVRARVHEALVRDGVREAINFSFTSADDIELMGHDPARAVRVANPLSADDAYLRTSLVPDLLRSVARTLARGTRGAALFEAGHVFWMDGEAPVREPENVAAVFSGSAGHGIHEDRRSFDFFDAKGALEALVGAFGVTSWRLGDPLGGPFHPARSAAVHVGEPQAGVLGELHPKVAERLDLPARTSVLELDTDVLRRHGSRGVAVRDVFRFPPALRDLAFIVDLAVPAGDLESAIRAAGGDLVRSITPFDQFSGGPIPAGRKSLAFSIEFRAPDRTLTDDEVEGLVGAIRNRLAGDFGAELRS